MSSRYTALERNILMLIEVAGPLTAEEVIARVRAVDAAAVRRSMHLLALSEDIDSDDAGRWSRSRMKP